jgi:hypothetical protein
MDDQRFDVITRAFAVGLTRRGAMRALVGGLAGTAAGLLGRPAAVLAEPKDAAPTCGACPRGERCVAGACCPTKLACADLCCPPQTVGCTELKLPDGTVKVGCLCPEGWEYDSPTNTCFGSQCRPVGVSCGGDADCCSGNCERGLCQCMPAGGSCADFECCGGSCPDGVCASCTLAGGACTTHAECCGMQIGKSGWGKCVDGICRCCYAGGYPACGDGVNPAADLCCDYPQVGYMCCDDPADCATCLVGCCTDGVDCDTTTNTFPGCPPTAQLVSQFDPDPGGCSP